MVKIIILAKIIKSRQRTLLVSSRHWEHS